MTQDQGQWTLKELALTGELEFGDGYRTKRSELGPSGFPILRVAEVLDGKIAPIYSEFVRPEFRSSMKHKVARPGDIVLTTKGTVGRVAMIPAESAEFSYSPQVCYFRITSGNKVIPKYLYYWLRSDAFRVQAARLKGQTDMADYLNLADIGSLKVTLPDPQSQRTITEVLGALDDKIAVNERIAETALALAKAHMGVVEYADPLCISDVADVFDGPHATPKKTTEGPWFLSISSLTGGILDLAESAHLAEEDFPRWTRRVQPSKGDVLFSYETRLGEAALMPPAVRASLGRRMGLLRPKPGAVRGALLLHAYLSPPFQEEIRRRTVHGATVDRIPLKEMPTWPIALPSVSVRDRLSDALEALHASIEQAAVENRTLADLRDTLIPQLVTGKIRVKDAVRVVEDVAS